MAFWLYFFISSDTDSDYHPGTGNAFWYIYKVSVFWEINPQLSKGQRRVRVSCKYWLFYK